MRMSSFFVPTLKEDPADAEVVSHRLMVRAGMIRRLTTGIYSYLPLGYRSLRKVEQIVREEMNAAGAQEVFLPMVQPAELWKNPAAGSCTEKSCNALRTGTIVNFVSDRHMRK